MSARHPPSGYYMGFTISTLIPNEVIISQNLATLGMMSPFSTREIYDLVEFLSLWSAGSTILCVKFSADISDHVLFCTHNILL